MSLFYAISFISAKKSFEGEKLGITYHHSSATGITVTKVEEGGLLSNTIVQEGQTITSANGLSLAGLDRKEVAGILSSLSHHVYLEVWTPIQCTRNEVPVFLSEATSSPVPLSKWQMIYDSVNNEMLPAIDTFKKLDLMLKKEMDRFVDQQMVKGHVGWGLESSHEKKVIEMVRQAAAASNNTTLVATNALCRATAMLCSHGIAVQLGFSQQKMEKFSSKLTHSLVTMKTPHNIGFMLFT